MKKLPTVYLIFVGLITLFLLIVHTFSLFNVVVDTFSVMLLILLIFIPLIPSFKKIKWGEFEAEISSEEINKIDKAIKKIKPLPKNEVKGYTEEEVQELKNYLFSLVEIDPVLALAKLRMELENLIRTVYNAITKLEGKKVKTFNVSLMISELEKNTDIDKDLLHNTKEVMMICNKTIHGGNIKLEDAAHVVALGMKIISYFYGYYSGYSSVLEKYSSELKEYGLLKE